MTKHYVDRSRWLTGFECPTKRFYTYHAEGSGYQGQYKGLELWTGGLIHKLLEKILISVQIEDKIPSREILRHAIEIAKDEYKKEQLPLCSEFTLLEQLWLSECLAWAFIKSQLPALLEQYQIISIEQEMPYEVDSEITLMVRPDLVLRRRSTGKLVLLDWKSSASQPGEDFIQEFATSPQMAAGTLAAERTLGEPVDEYMIYALIKGSRKIFTKGKGEKQNRSNEKRQYSNLCYAKVSEAAPPLTERSYDLSGFWLDKTPLWTLDLKPEEWIDTLALSELLENFLIIGPYPKQEFMLKQFLQSLKVEERKWLEIDRELEELRKRNDFTPEREHLVMDASVPKSFQCFSYGSMCSFYDLCFKVGDKWKEPLENGWSRRVPHHETEKIK